MASDTFDDDYPDPIAEDTAVIDDSDLDIEVEIADDTPIADQGKRDNPDDFDDGADDEVLQYSAKVQKRIDKLTAKAETERRAREKLQREHAQAVEALQATMAVNQRSEAEAKRLRAQLQQGESVYVQEVIGSLESQLANAKAQYKHAYENGLSDELVAANETIAALTHRMQMAKNYRPPAVEAEPEATPTPTAAPAAPVVQKVEDPIFDAWRGRNTWFDNAEHGDMRALATALHQKLVMEGVHPIHDAEQYYKTIDATMRKRFPEYKWPEQMQTQRSRTPGNSVPSAPRGKQTVKLTKSEADLAASLGLTPQQYAAEKLALARKQRS